MMAELPPDIERFLNTLPSDPSLLIEITPQASSWFFRLIVIFPFVPSIIVLPLE